MNKSTIVSNVMKEYIHVAKSIPIGTTIENDTLRVHRFSPSIRITDLTNAGKRGKTVNEFTIYDIDYYDKKPEIIKQFDYLSREKDYNRALKKAKQILQNIDYDKLGIRAPIIKIYENTMKGVDVKPAGFKEIKIKGKGVTIEADYNSFFIQNTSDTYNLETCIPSIKGKKTSINQFYRWLTDNQNKVKSMTFQEIKNELDKANIKTHYYCAMD